MVVFALQMMFLGETPVGAFKRSWWLIAVGIAFTATGAFACIVPDTMTGLLRGFLGLLNIFAGATFFGRRLLQTIRDRKVPPPGPAPPIVKEVRSNPDGPQRRCDRLRDYHVSAEPGAGPYQRP